jgi:hypothetical protein
MPLPEELRQIGQRIVDWYRQREAGNEPPPYHVYVYRPRDEWKTRQAARDLATWLEAPGRLVPCVFVSLADVLWRAVEESGWAEELFAQEREAGADPVAQAEVHRAVAELLRSPVSFSSRVIEAIESAVPQPALAPAAVFLYRAASLYPVFRTSGLLDDIRPRLAVPVTLLYPGELKGDFGLRFMGKWDPTYNYRALIVDGTGARQ